MTIQLKIKLFASLTILLSGLSWTQEIDESSNSDEKKLDSPKKKQQQWGGLPAYGYREETGHQYGALVVYYLPQAEGTTKPSDITNAVLHSTRNQLRIVTNPSIFWDKDRKHYVGTIDYQNWPTQFFGMGENPQYEEVSPLPDAESQDPLKGLLYYAELLSVNNFYEISPNGDWWIGLENRFNYRKVDFPRKGKLVEENFQNMSGVNGGITSGIGFVSSLDLRDNINSAHKGYLASWTTRIYGKALGSDFNYNEHRLDLRYYIPLPAEQTIAMRSFQWVQFGDVPFYNLASSDGNTSLRGVPIGFYQDQQLSSYQIEYRSIPLPWRFGLRLFGDATQVRPNFDMIADAKYNYTYGLGIRWALNPEQKFNIRLELPIVNGALSPVVQIKEAF